MTNDELQNLRLACEWGFRCHENGKNLTLALAELSGHLGIEEENATTRQIMEAYRRLRRQPDGAPFIKAAERLRNGKRDWEQTHHGSTDYALAAWVTFVDGGKHGRCTKVSGVQDYLVPDAKGRRTIKEAALLIERGDERMFLTGCWWGYGGEGPHGTALILHDMGAFPTYEDALAFVRQKDMKGDWMLEVKR